MMDRFSDLLMTLAAAFALPASAFANSDDCSKTSNWKPTKTNTNFKRVKVQISAVNKTDQLVTVQFNWTDTAGNARTEAPKSMLYGQEIRKELTISGIDGVAKFQTVFGDRGTAQFLVKYQNKEESQFKPSEIPNGVTCDRIFGNNDNIWKISYVVKTPTIILPPGVQR